MVDPRSFMAFRIFPRFNDTQLGVATAFLYENDQRTFLVTNWHNVTGRRPDTHEVIHTKAAIPNNFLAGLHCMTLGSDGKVDSGIVTINLPLYFDAEMMQPTWLEHPLLGCRVDVVAIEIHEGRMTGNYPGWNSLVRVSRGETDLRASIGSDAYILGFPRGIGGGDFPIWKRGSIATEAYTEIDGLPKLYVDTATKEGMSGAPVFLASNGFVHREDPSIRAIANGIVHRFIGVYSGRVGDSALEAQLGIVWKESALMDILESGVPGSPSIQLSRKSQDS